MSQIPVLPISLAPADIAALVLLFTGWLGIGWVTEHPPAGRPSVSVLMAGFRREWMQHFVTRDPRIFDSNILASLREGTAFFASACMIAIGGTLALIGNGERLTGLARDFELADVSTTQWEIRLLVPMFFVVDAFLKFVWAHRLFGYCAVMMGSVTNDVTDPVARERADQAADLNITAARSFNSGLRSVYFALGGLAWLAGPWPLIAATAFVLLMTWRREFASTSRAVILRNLPPDPLRDPATPPESAPPPPQP